MYGMFTTEGNELVGAIATAGAKLAKEDGAASAWGFCLRKLETLSYGSFMKDGVEQTFGEATDTAVREAVYDTVVGAAGDTCDFYQ
jgi:hypothetical protein